ncbi:hypothetical protein [Halosimplex amylolyticum]|uniref:hypothetical protein n=1 Tax=Halosimplex amylolyticum TaxID=3396616 RepID=UPI003F5577B6
MSARESIVNAACSQRQQAKPLLLVLAVLTALLAFSLFYLEPQTPAYNIALIDIGVLALGFVLFGGTFWYCTRREMDEAETIGERYREDGREADDQ